MRSIHSGVSFLAKRYKCSLRTEKKVLRRTNIHCQCFTGIITKGVVKDDKQEVILLIKDRKDDGLGYRAICRELEGCGYKPMGRLWHPQTIKNILHKASQVI
jgi:hypothetical protein